MHPYQLPDLAALGHTWSSLNGSTDRTCDDGNVECERLAKPVIFLISQCLFLILRYPSYCFEKPRVFGDLGAFP
jgi:hypothetical protein